MNESFGWAWITLGFASGALLGLRFHRDDFLGGYGSYRRRLLRLGHISFIGLGMLNVLFQVSAARAEWSDFERQVASISMVAAGIAMPAACGLPAWRASLKPVFAVPVASLVLAGVTIASGLLRGVQR